MKAALSRAASTGISTHPHETATEYLLLINAEEARENAMTPQEMGALMEAYGKFGAEATAAGVLHGGERLRPVSDATTVRVREDKTLTTDGLFAETKEQFGGFYRIDVPDLDAAIEWAAKIPSVKMGSVEVRPIWDMSAASPEEATAGNQQA
ncbi:MAG: hypothetical protein ACI841_002728 [Planctomycetota bacterium]